MAESTRLVDLVQADIDSFLDDREPRLLDITPDLAPFIDFSRDLLRGGKRFRAQFCYWGWQAVSGTANGSASGTASDSTTDSTGQPAAVAGTDLAGSNSDLAGSSSDLPSIVLAASALEVFHAAALVHDDIMDNSDTRRGLPSTHRRFESMHSRDAWAGSGRTFGQSAALLLGDLLLGWSDELFDEATRGITDPSARTSAREEFNRMRTEVTLGQYLDILEERSWPEYTQPEQLERAHRVIVYKSAKYSIEAPLAIGASLAGADAEQLLALKGFGLPLGIAYQLRDDVLGVFGDPLVTGKPAGDDLREGKRTVIVALARTSLDDDARAHLDGLLGDPTLTDGQVSALQQSILDSGAVDQVERIIDQNVGIALKALVDSPISTDARARLEAMAETVTKRSA